jgi:hypothetical protein
MSVNEMQACLARLYLDEPFRRLFYLDPTVLEGYWLTDEELAAIRGIRREELEYYASSLKNKRRARIERAYPMLFTLAPADIGKYYSRYYQLHIAKTTLSPQQDTLAFGAFVEDSVCGVDHMPPFTADIARYERLYYQARFTPAPQARPGEPAPARQRPNDVTPYRLGGVEIAAFDYDVADLEDRMHRGTDLLNARDITPSPSAIVFRPATRTAAIKVLRINPATQALIDHCDGVRTVSDIVAALEASSGQVDLGPAITAGLDRLMALEVLTPDPRLAVSADPGAHVHGYAMSESM